LLHPLQTRAPQQHNRTVLAFAEFRAKVAGGVGLTCRVAILVPAFGIAAMGPSVATFAVLPASPLDEVRRARILSGNIIHPDRFRPRLPPRPLHQSPVASEFATDTFDNRLVTRRIVRKRLPARVACSFAARVPSGPANFAGTPPPRQSALRPRQNNGGERSVFGRKSNNASVATEQHNAP
jgi:hypothetical protein